jgi:tRNA(Ile)-lysidine synthase
VEQALARAARIAAADADLLDELAAAEMTRHVRLGSGTATLEMARLRTLPEALARRVVRGALQAVDPHHTHGWADTDAVLTGDAGGVRQLGAVRMERIGPSVVLTLRGPGRSPSGAPGPSLPLTVPGRAAHPAGWWTVDAEGPLPPSDAPPPAANRAVLDASALGRHLTVRGWLPGDRVQPLGLGGRKKLQDLFVDRKVPRDERELVPLVLDAEDRIAWVGGHVVAEPFRVTPLTSGVVVLTLRR